MKDEQNINDEMLKVEQFWADAKVLLDKHYAKKRKRIVWLSFSASIMLVLGILFSSNNNSIKNVNNKLTAKKAASKSISSLKLNEPSKKNNANIKENSTSQSQQKSSNAREQITKKTSIKNEEKYRYENSLSANATSQITTIESIMIDSEIIQKSNETVATIEPIAQPLVQDKIIPEKEIASTFTESIPQNKTNFELMNILRYKDLNNKKNAQIKEAMLPIQVNTEPYDYTQIIKKWSYSVAINAGVAKVGKKLKGDELFNEYVDIRMTQEKEIYTPQFGVEVNFQKSKFVFNTGIQYKQFGENNQYAALSKQLQINDDSKWNTFNKQIVDVDTLYIFGIVQYQSNLVGVKDSVLEIKKDSIYAYASDSSILKANGKTNYTYLEIPLQIGYEFKSGKWALTPMAGISFGYLISSNASYINKNINKIESISETNAIKNYMLNYTCRLNLTYNINRKIGVSFAPMFSANVFSITKGNFGVNSRYYAKGIIAGINLKL